MNTLLLLASQALLFPQQPDIYLEVVGSISNKQNWAFYAPHENENVVNTYVADKISNEGGIFVVMRQSGERLIKMNINQQVIKVDPNRIFTNIGRRDSIKKHNPNLNRTSGTYEDAVDRTQQLSEFVLSTMGGIKNKRSWVAIHNNTNGYDDDGSGGIGNISIVRYQHKLDSDAAYLIDVSASEHDEDDLYFITDPNDFKVMKDNDWNVVLQNPNVAHDITEDDGSLSVYAEMIGFRYINVEAERINNGIGSDHLDVQKQMVDFTFSLLEGK